MLPAEGATPPKIIEAVLGPACPDPSPSLVVDTHVTRISNLLKFVRTKDAVKIEKELCQIVVEKEWTLFAHLLIDHGRTVCIANRPKCQNCVIADFCPSNKGDT